MNWTTQQIPNLTGKNIIVTGATSGLGKEISKVLAQKGATVIMAVRNTEKAKLVCDEISKNYSNAKLIIKKLDLSSLKSINLFSTEINNEFGHLDILINNAGVMYCPYSKTQDGFEMQMGTNHLGPFALTIQLLPVLFKTPNSRIINTSSLAHLTGNINFDDIHWEQRKYKTMQAYADSKIANLYFSYELASKLEDKPNAPLVIAAHPGWVKTELDRHIGWVGIVSSIIGQKPEMGILPTLMASFDPEANNGDYYGASGFREMRGFPKKVQSNVKSRDETLAKKLWELSEELTGIKF
ncbi:MAG: oxidoreductase [Cytophagales bacterium]